MQDQGGKCPKSFVTEHKTFVMILVLFCKGGESCRGQAFASKTLRSLANQGQVIKMAGLSYDFHNLIASFESS